MVVYMALIIRKAKFPDDEAEMARMGYAFFGKTPYAKVTTFDPESMLRFARMIVGSGDGEVLIAEKDGRVIGATGAIMCPLYMSKDYKIATELFWWVDDTERKGAIGITLIKALEDWARVNGVQMLALAAIEGMQTDRICNLYKHFGYEPTERTYSKEM